MPFVKYAANRDPDDGFGKVLIREGTFTIQLGKSYVLTDEEIAELNEVIIFEPGEGDESQERIWLPVVRDPQSGGLAMVEGGVKTPFAADRQEIIFSTSSLAAEGAEDMDVVLVKAGALYSIEANRPAWIRAYGTESHRSVDSARDISQDPTGNHGVLLEVAFTPLVLKLDLAPVVHLANVETPVNDTIYFAVTNLDASSGVVEVTLTFRQEE